MLVRTIKKNSQGVIEVRDTNSEIGLDNELAYGFDPAGRIIVDHPTDNRSILIAQSDDLRQGVKLTVPIDSQEFELQIHNQEDVFVIEDRSSLKNELVKLFSKGGASGEGLGYRELYGRIEWDVFNGKPVMVVEYNTLEFEPLFNNDGNFFIRLDKENLNGTSLHSSIKSIDKVHVYATKSLENNREVFFSYGINKEENTIPFVVKELVTIQDTLSINFDVEIPSSTSNIFQNLSFPVNVGGNIETVNTNINFDVTIPSSTQNVNKNINVPSKGIQNITMQDGLCDNSGDNFYNTKFRIVVLD